MYIYKHIYIYRHVNIHIYIDMYMYMYLKMEHCTPCRLSLLVSIHPIVSSSLQVPETVVKLEL